MPSYDYYCPENHKTVEVNHRMSELMRSWGDVCARAEIEPGDTPSESPVQKQISGGAFIHSPGEGGGSSVPEFSGSSCCNRGGCGCA